MTDFLNTNNSSTNNPPVAKPEVKDFSGFGLPSSIMQSLTQMGYTTPTPIQAQAIPLALAGRDILGTAQTGTGKTAAFAIPLIAQLIASPRGTALILTPTRELATQVIGIMNQLLKNQHNIKSALLIGGESMPRQQNQLRARPRLIVGTPGRVNDHLTRGSLMLHDTKFLVLDETDRMLDMGFGVQIDAILKFATQARQTLLFSATLPDAIIKMSKKYLTNPERISVGSTSKPSINIAQEVMHVSTENKYNELIKQLDARKGSILIFVKTKRSADKLAEKLYKQGFKADAIHGDLRQHQRNRVIQGFRDQRFRILVATDVAARGLDIPHIEHVINYNLPQCPEDYIHRIGRTARAGAEGSSLCLISPDEAGKWREIQQLLNPNAKHTGGSHGGSNGGHGGGRHGHGGKPSGNKPFRFNRHKSRGRFDNRRAA